MDEFIRKDGSTNTTDAIPFAEGIAVSRVKSLDGKPTEFANGIRIPAANGSYVDLEIDEVQGYPALVFKEPGGVKARISLLGGSEFDITVHDSSGRVVNCINMNVDSEMEFLSRYYNWYLPNGQASYATARMTLTQSGFGYGRNMDYNDSANAPTGVDIRDDVKLTEGFGIHGRPPLAQFVANSADGVTGGMGTRKYNMNDIVRALKNAGNIGI